MFKRQWLKKIKKSRCYACNNKGHECWSCPLKNKKKTDDDDDEISVWVRNIQEDDNKVQAYGEYVVQGTDEGNWDKICYVSKFYSKHMTPNQDLFLRFKPCFDPETQELDTHFLVSNGVGEILLERKPNI